VSLQYFRDLGDYTNFHQEPLWIDTEHELGKGGFGVVLKGELGHKVVVTMCYAGYI